MSLRRGLLGAALIAATAVAGVGCPPQEIVVKGSQDDSTPEVCRYFDKDVEKVWSTDTKQEVKTALGRTRVSQQTGTFSEKVVTNMDKALQNWVYQREAACKDCYQAGGGKPEHVLLYTYKSNCFDSSLNEHTFLMELIKQHPDEKTAVNAMDAMGKLRIDMTKCLEEAAGRWYAMVSQQQGGAAPPQAQPEPVAYAEEDMSRAKVARYLSLEAEANNSTDKAMSAATARNDVPLQVQVMIEEAKTDHAFARYNDAYAKFEQAWNLALTVQDAYGAAEAAMGLADVLAENAYYQQAIEWYIKVEDICKSSIGTTSHQYAVLLIHFADVLAKVGRAKESFEFAQQAFNILVQIVAGQSSEQAAYEQAAAFQADLAECFRIFGQAADYAGDAQEAVNQTTKAVEMASAVYGVNHPKVAADFVNLAWIYAYNGQFDRAYQFAEKAQRIVTDLFGYSHPGVCDALEALAGISAANGDYARAQQYYTKSLTVKTDYYDPRHPSIANTHYSIGGMYRDAGQYDAAIEEFNMALTIYQTAFPNEDHPFVGAALYGLALTYQAAGRHPEAIEKFDSSVEIYKKAYGEAAQEVAWVMTKRGISLKADGKTRKACKDFTAAYDILKNLFGEGHSYVTEAASNLEQCPQ